MNTLDPEMRWYCIRSKPKRQNVAAAHLQAQGIEVFNPQLRYRRATRRGPAWSTQPLFLNYLFARFDLLPFFRKARYAFGVNDILRFGNRWAEIPEHEILALKAIWESPNSPVEPAQNIEVGATVKLAGGLFHGMEVEVVALLPARQRVKVLLDFLGGFKEAEVDSAAVLPAVSHPLAV